MCFFKSGLGPRNSRIRAYDLETGIITTKVGTEHGYAGEKKATARALWKALQQKSVVCVRCVRCVRCVCARRWRSTEWGEAQRPNGRRLWWLPRCAARTPTADDVHVMCLWSLPRFIHETIHSVWYKVCQDLQQHVELCKTKISSIHALARVSSQSAKDTGWQTLAIQPFAEPGAQWQRPDQGRAVSGSLQTFYFTFPSTAKSFSILFPCFLVSFGCSCIETLSHLMFFLSFPLVIVFVSERNPPLVSYSRYSILMYLMYPLYDPKIDSFSIRLWAGRSEFHPVSQTSSRPSSEALARPRIKETINWSVHMDFTSWWLHDTTQNSNSFHHFF